MAETGMEMAQPRSFLFVPGNDEAKLEKAFASQADCMLIDLEDSVASNAKGLARASTARFLASHLAHGDRPSFYVRVNDLGSGLTVEDLEAVLPLAEGIMLPKANSGADIWTLAAMIEAVGGAAADNIGILAIATETPLALLQMATFVNAHPRLEGLTWGAEDLGTAIGATSARDASGAFTGPFALARNLCLIAAHAAGVQAIDSIFADFRDEAGLAREASEAARDGFAGKMAIHPGQLAAINAAFTPTPEAIAEAKTIVAAFDANPGAGVIGLAGRMVDRPHLVRAQRLLGRLAGHAG